VLKVANPGPDGWVFIIGVSLVPLVLVQIAKLALKGKVGKDYNAYAGVEDVESTAGQAEIPQDKDGGSGQNRGRDKDGEAGNKSQDKEEKEHRRNRP
jgi:hypothetical protein